MSHLTSFRVTKYEALNILLSLAFIISNIFDPSYCNFNGCRLHYIDLHTTGHLHINIGLFYIFWLHFSYDSTKNK